MGRWEPGARERLVVAAVALGVGFVPVRKAGKLPWEIEREEYALEYGSDLLEIHRDAVHPGERVLIVDDVIATGGTAAATARLVERLGGTVAGFTFLIELAALNGRAQLRHGHDGLAALHVAAVRVGVREGGIGAAFHLRRT